jgi:hypothetical protein
MTTTERRFAGTLTAGDSKRHIEYEFDVPGGTARLEMRLSYTPAQVDGISNMLTLSLFDPHGARGAGHRGGTAHAVTIDSSQATPGYSAGPLPAGRWSVAIDTHMVMPGAPCAYELEVATYAEAQPAAAATPRRAAKPAQRGPGWYRGDLHGHTIHSDGAWDVPDLVAAARAYGLDFVTLSDHNTVSGLEQVDELGGADLLTMGGMELTTFWGHALALGLRRWIDWRVRPGQRTMPQIAEEVAAAGGLFIIAHPMSVGDPKCTGCDWRYVDMLPGPAPVVEVWNGGAWSGESNNEQALALWYTWLNQGRRLVATAGTDVHAPPPEGVRPGFNIVYADDLSEAAILRAIGRGHLYLSSGPRVELVGRASAGAQAMIGDTLPCAEAEIRAGWSACAVGDRLRLIVDGRPLEELAIEAQGERSWAFGAGQMRWCTVELRDSRDQLLAVTNPIFWDCG